MSKKYYRSHKKHNQHLLQLSEQIISLFLKNPQKPLNFKQVSAGIQQDTPNERNDVIKVLQKLTAEKRLEEVTKGKFQFLASEDHVEGIIDFTASGAAFVMVEEMEEDIYIPKGNTGRALHGDWVSVYVYKRKKSNNKLEGEVLDVIKRTKSQFVGIFTHKEDADYAFVIPDNKKICVDIFIKKQDFDVARDGEKVLVKVTDWSANTRNPFGKIVDVFGTPGEHEVEMHSILADYGLPYEFSQEVQQAADQLPTAITANEIAKRRDMRSVTTFTIDPADAKDFDDAISIQEKENGLWEIGVHIADVAHYVIPDSILDEEAYQRATSVYLVDRVVPMLPEVLSNEVCSLRPHEEKLTFSAVFEMNEQGQVVSQWFGRTVILSDRRFSYEEAQEIIENQSGELAQEILILHKLATLLREERQRQGAISFDKVEVKFKLDETSFPIGVYFKIAKEANHLIEEFMLLANRKVSEFVSLDKHHKPTTNTFVYRVHDDPDPDKLFALKAFIKQFGYDLDLENKAMISQAMNQLLASVRGKAESNMIETLAMRTMSKAVYSTENIGHYGLTFAYYTHFTSPIRRYPDIIAHRLLQHYLDGGRSPQKESYEEACVHCSNQERTAAEAERDSIKYMQVKYMEKHIGETFSGVISGVTEWGVYVELPETLSEGLIRLRDIRDDHYIYDEKKHAIEGLYKKRILRLGDKVNIKLKAANLEKKQLDFELIVDDI